MRHHPFVSICIPAYREPDKLAKLLDSIASQDFSDFEVIVSDDSPDDSVKHTCERFPQLAIRYFKNTPSKGSPANWNFAIAQASAPWIKLIHHDDYFYSASALRRFVQATQDQPDADYFFSNTFIFESTVEKGRVYGVDMQVLDRISEQPAYLFHRNLIGAPSVGFFKQSMHLRFDEQLIWLVDVEFYCRLLFQHTVGHIPEPLVTTVVSDSQLTTGLRNVIKFEVGEFLYSYHKLMPHFNTLNRRIMRMRMLDLCLQYEIKSATNLRKAGITGPLPALMKLLMACNRVHSNFTRSLFYRLFKFELLR
jgi:glycosyltransferase involved in cell wall biosynthesis